jgi:hypothetical protein
MVGGLSGGGLTLLATGTVTLLGPLGLLGGALVGWKLASLVGGHRSLEQARDAIASRLDEIAAAMLRDVDDQVESAVATVRSAVQRRRRAFAADLYQQFEVVQSISEHPEALEAQRRDAARFIEAFEACATEARAALRTPLAAVG